MASAASQLVGLVLDRGWKVISIVDTHSNSTGGVFSIGYIVKNVDGRSAFLKALDYSAALRSADPARMLQELTAAFNFERDTLRSCGHLDRVVTAIDDGSVRVSSNVDGIVQYLIFELASGNARSRSDFSKGFDLVWLLRALHHVSTGLWQLHNNSIAHQDIKPSNVLVFPDNVSKVSDLGRAAYKGHNPPHENSKIAGDPAYAPPELHYGYIDPDWNLRRRGCDLYLLGSMAVFFITGVGVTAQLKTHLHQGHRWGMWSGTYEEVLPYVKSSFDMVIEVFESNLLARVDNEALSQELVSIVKQLCDPDPRLRGHPRNVVNKSDQYSLERYVSTFNLLATRAEIGLFRRVGQNVVHR